MKKIFLSLPMRGRTDEAIQETINRMEQIIKSYYPNEPIEFMHNFNPLITKEIETFKKSQPEMIKKEPLWYLSYAVKQMAQCDTLVHIRNYVGEWDYRGCVLENNLARDYNINILEIDDNNGYLLPDIKANYEEEIKKYREPASSKGDVCAPSVGCK